MKSERPRIVRIHDVQIDSNYYQWLNEIKSRYRSSQIKAAIKVNAELLLFNWQLGKWNFLKFSDWFHGDTTSKSSVNVKLLMKRSST